MRPPRTTRDVRVQIQILQVSDCPNAARAHETVARALRRTGVEAAVEDVLGDYSSPTVLVAGQDVTGRAVRRHRACCRLDLPTEEQVMAALRQVALVEPPAPP